MSSFKIYRTDNRNVTKLSVPKGGPHKDTAVVKLDMSLKAGDVVSLVGTFEVTDDLGVNVMIGRYLKEYNPTTGKSTILSTPMAMNVTPDMHHMPSPSTAFFQAKETRKHRFIMIGCAASSQARSGNTVSVDYVDLQALVVSL